MPDPARARRLAKRISTIVASAIEFEIKDPRLTGVTITDAKVTGDLHDATLFYSVFGSNLEDEPDYAGVAAALEKAKGVLRTRVGAALGVRFTPTLAFERDTVPDTAHHMEDLLARARAADEDLARVRQGAKHAGDADPYRKDGAEGSSGDLDVGLDAEDTGDRNRQDD
jgi:ribosome-binding factor A